MTLQEAIKSGKRFKREGNKLWLSIRHDGYACFSVNEPAWIFNYESILATDWITEEPVKKVKRITVWRPIYFHLFEGFHSPSNWNEKHHSCWDRYKESGHTRVGWESKEIEVEE